MQAFKQIKVSFVVNYKTELEQVILRIAETNEVAVLWFNQILYLITEQLPQIKRSESLHCVSLLVTTLNTWYCLHNKTYIVFLCYKPWIKPLFLSILTDPRWLWRSKKNTENWSYRRSRWCKSQQWLWPLRAVHSQKSVIPLGLCEFALTTWEWSQKRCSLGMEGVGLQTVPTQHDRHVKMFGKLSEKSVMFSGSGISGVRPRWAPPPSGPQTN